MSLALPEFYDCELCVYRTVRNLGMMNGALLLGMKRDDIRAVCPEEGGRVFFQLQAIKSSMAVCINVHTHTV